jgi:3-dehydroquinate synthase
MIYFFTFALDINKNKLMYMEQRWTTMELDYYKIYIGNVADTWASALGNNGYSKIFIIVDENTQQHCLPLFLQQAQLSDYSVVRVAAGEKYKNTATCDMIWKSMLEAQLDRKSLCINLGGGVIGDMGGYCAATFKRGIDFVHIPTTLLSQVDSSIGGKLGIDFYGVKNCIGVFKNPKAVFIDTTFLATLSQREIRSGFAEMLKHALIANEEEWHRLREMKEMYKVDWMTHIPISLEIKQNIVREDPFEQHIRKALNFGHTIGHAIESYFLPSQQQLLHGEAIAIGMVCESFLAYQKGLLTFRELDMITTTMRSLYNIIEIPTESHTALIDLMYQDKKNEHQVINFTLLKGIGQFEINQSVTQEQIIESFNFINLMTTPSIA